MKLVKILVCLAMILSLMLCVAACGEDEGLLGGITGGSSKNSIAGKYEFYSMSYDGETITAEDLADMGEEMDMYIRLNDDGSGIMYSEGDTEDMAYANGQIWPADEPDEKVDFTVKGDTLTMEQDGMVMKFKK